MTYPVDLPYRSIAYSIYISPVIYIIELDEKWFGRTQNYKVVLSTQNGMPFQSFAFAKVVSRMFPKGTAAVILQFTA